MVVGHCSFRAFSGSINIMQDPDLVPGCVVLESTEVFFVKARNSACMRVPNAVICHEGVPPRVLGPRRSRGIHLACLSPLQRFPWIKRLPVTLTPWRNSPFFLSLRLPPSNLGVFSGACDPWDFVGFHQKFREPVWLANTCIHVISDTAVKHRETQKWTKHFRSWKVHKKTMNLRDLSRKILT